MMTGKKEFYFLLEILTAHNFFNKQFIFSQLSEIVRKALTITIVNSNFSFFILIAHKIGESCFTIENCCFHHFTPISPLNILICVFIIKQLALINFRTKNLEIYFCPSLPNF
jgi:hypothetical protein